MTVYAKFFRMDDIRNFTPDVAVVCGDITQMADGKAGVPNLALPAGDLAGMQMSGVFSAPKTTGQVWVDGCELWWDFSAFALTNIPRMGAGDRDFYAGTAVGDATSAATTGYVNLNNRPVYEIDLARDPFVPIVVKTVVGSTTVEIPHVEARGGGMSLILGTTAEAQKVDLLSERSFALNSNWIVEGEINVQTNGDAAAFDFNCGVANATHASDADSITESCFLHIDGNSVNILAESDDGTTEVAATDTTIDFTAGTPFHFVMDGRNPADVQIYINSVLMLPDTVFNIAAATGPLKLLAHAEKSSDDSPGTIQINRLRVRTAKQ